ncbi:MAG: PAS domain-containing sensor histidine kinase, partial [Rubrivivax sp.]|nr:PAS domain-containing sensor histidine kinase [Rubrivivax sp.]
TGDGVWDWDLAQGREQLSAQGLALFGYRPGELPDSAEALDALTHPDDREAMVRAREDHFAGRTAAYVNEHRVRCKDGRWKWVLSRGVVMRRDAWGRPLRMVGTHTDIDAAKHAEQLRHERDRAAAADLAKSQFLSRVSHELRTPLNAVLGFAQLLQMADGTLPADTREGYLRHIVEGGRHLLTLVDEVLDLSAAQTGQLQVLCTPMPLLPVMHAVLQLFSGAAAGADVALNGPLPAEASPPEVRGDERRCRQVLANLVSNAIKYNRPGGRVDLSWAADGEMVQVSVRDTGSGLDEAQLARLFQPFERLGADHGTVQGTGLGLALSRQLVEAMGGRIAVQSEPGVGSTFTLCLPRADAQPRSDGRD